MKATASIAVMIAVLGTTIATQAQPGLAGPGLAGSYAETSWLATDSFTMAERDDMEALLTQPPVEKHQLNTERLSGQVVETLGDRLEAQLQLSIDAELATASQE